MILKMEMVKCYLDPQYADPFAGDAEKDVKFFKIINKGTDEEVYSHLLSSLMNCAMNMKA